LLRLNSGFVITENKKVYKFEGEKYFKMEMPFYIFAETSVMLIDKNRNNWMLKNPCQ
jgi:hypothetical protein